MTDVQMTFGIRRWVRVAVFVGWLIYYSLAFQSWRDAFSERYAAWVAKYGTWIR
jgi:hypothetical protein